jgi:hypothetical protein
MKYLELRVNVSELKSFHSQIPRTERNFKCFLQCFFSSERLRRPTGTEKDYHYEDTTEESRHCPIFFTVFFLVLGLTLLSPGSNSAFIEGNFSSDLAVCSMPALLDTNLCEFQQVEEAYYRCYATSTFYSHWLWLGPLSLGDNPELGRLFWVTFPITRVSFLSWAIANNKCISLSFFLSMNFNIQIFVKYVGIG